MKQISIKQMENLKGGRFFSVLCNTAATAAGNTTQLLLTANLIMKGGKIGAAAGPVGVVTGVLVGAAFSVLYC